MSEEGISDRFLRPGIIEALIRLEKDPFESKNVQSYRDESDIGRALNSLEEEGALEAEDDVQNKSYGFGDGTRMGNYMLRAKRKWWDMIDNKSAKYDVDKLEEDIPEGLFISESNSGKRKLFERRDHPLHEQTKQYLSEIGAIRDTEDMKVVADEIDIEMLRNYFRGEEWNYE